MKKKDASKIAREFPLLHFVMGHRWRPASLDGQISGNPQGHTGLPFEDEATLSFENTKAWREERYQRLFG